ncbi:MAG: DUF3467 domain-containing protein [Deltaproteobacteria bacterium]|nr:DUF3467 domain-containing protein [Deltaproteobacteria bacterium]
MTTIKTGRNALPFDIDMSEDVAKGQYSNTFILNHTENEFILDFALQAPGIEKVKILQRIIITPKQMEKLTMLMGESLEKYKTVYGAKKEKPTSLN